MKTKEEIFESFKIFYGGDDGEGIEKWISAKTSSDVIDRLARIDEKPLSKVQLEQLLVMSHEAGISEGFFQYYWLEKPMHTYDIKALPGIESVNGENYTIKSLEHLKWGIYRLYIDCLLYFGNIRSGYRYLRNKHYEEIVSFFQRKKYNIESIKKRGPALPLKSFFKDSRYLISEMACKSYDSADSATSNLQKILTEAFMEHKKNKGGRVTVKELLDGSYVNNSYKDNKTALLFSADEILEQEIENIEDIVIKYKKISDAFLEARTAALKNTEYYLSMVNDLDVYVATSMRSRDDFRSMADTCDIIFNDKRLVEFNLRYFDPTLSAAEGHEDKGLIECLMVKSAKVLVYSAGIKESYGKDAEAAMAFSMGKPVIFLCDEGNKEYFYKTVHPLSRLIQFDTGVAVGTLVTSKKDHVIELLYRIFNNSMQYVLEQKKEGYFLVKDQLTKSVVRLQTNNKLIKETFWNYYHNRPAEKS